MKIPKKIKICGLDYTIELSDKLVEDDNASGQHIPTKLKIKLHVGNYHPQKIEQTFWHEILHAINTNYCGQKELTEEQVDTFANGFYQVLKDNNLLK